MSVDLFLNYMKDYVKVRCEARGNCIENWFHQNGSCERSETFWNCRERAFGGITFFCKL